MVRKDTDSKRNAFDKKFLFDININSENNSIISIPTYKKKIHITKSEPAKKNFFPKAIFMSILSENGLKAFYRKEDLYNKETERFEINWDVSDFPKMIRSFKNVSDPCLGIGIKKSELKPNESKRIVCIFGYSEVENIDNLIRKYKEITKKGSILVWNAQNWKRSIIRLNCDKDPWLFRETQWHSYYVRSSCYFDEYYNQHKFPQGSIYLFGHGFDGAIRDFILYLNSIIFIDVNLAREYLIFILSLMEPDGKLPYALNGFLY